MKKIGIFTLTDALNYGAFYQMYALQEYLNENYDNDYLVTVYSPKESFKGKLLKYFSYSLKRFYRKSILRIKFNQNMKRVNIKTYTGEHLDIAFFGSDEIWNIENKSFPNDPNFFGLGVNATKKIAYAPSIGFAKIQSFNLYPELLESIKDLDAVFYRDNGTKILAEKAGQKKLTRVVDPTILYDNWDKYIIPFKSNPSQPYIAYYSYLSDPPFLETLIKFSKERKLPIISAGFNTHPWADENLALSPWEFLSFLKNAEYIFTTTFHGTIMSTLLEKLVFFSPISHKVKDFSTMMRLSEYELTEKTTIQDINKIIDNYQSTTIINKKNELKSESQLYIESLFKN